MFEYSDYNMDLVTDSLFPLGDLIKGRGGTNQFNVNIQARYIFRKFMEIYASMFSWNDCPDSLNPFFIERVLATKGRIMICKDDVIGVIALDIAANSTLDIYGEYQDVIGISRNGGTWKRKKGEYVVVYNNIIKTTDVDLMRHYSLMIAEIELTARINAKSHIQTGILTMEDKDNLTKKNIMQQIEEYQPFICVSSKMAQAVTDWLNYINVQNTTDPNQIWQLRENVFKSVLQFIGVSGYSQKKSNLTVYEVQSQDIVSKSIYTGRLESRERAISQINEMFGLEINLGYTDMLNLVNQLEMEETRNGLPSKPDTIGEDSEKDIDPKNKLGIIKLKGKEDKDE